MCLSQLIEKWQRYVGVIRQAGWQLQQETAELFAKRSNLVKE